MEEQFDQWRKMADGLSRVSDTGTDLSKQLSDLNTQANNQQQEINALAFIAHSNPTAYTLLESLPDYQIKSFEIMPDETPTIVLENKQGRRVTLEFRKALQEKNTAELLKAIQVAIDLDGFDQPGRNGECDEALDELLDELSAITVIRERQTESPKPLPPSLESERERTVQKNETDHNHVAGTV